MSRRFFSDTTPAFQFVFDYDLVLADTTTNNASTAKHGFVPKLPGNAGLFLNGIGGFTAPPGNLPGPPGPQGAQGLPGMPGNDGEDGDTGPIGASGPLGLTGPQGSPGVAGEDGDDGDPGLMGPVGLTGSTGATGPSGPAGAVGNWYPGDEGDPGLDGIPGPVGPTGATGAVGPLGPAVYFAAEPGEDGDTIPGPRGYTGATGAAGPMGPTPVYDDPVFEDLVMPMWTSVTGLPGQLLEAQPVDASPDLPVILPASYSLVIARKYAPQNKVSLGANAVLRIL